MTKPYLILGLGVTGVSAARWCVRHGHQFDLCDSREALSNLAQIKQEFPKANIFLGQLNEQLLTQYSTIILSPGVALAEPAIAKAIAAGVRVIGDVQLFIEQAPKNIIAITGSNGKSTVTTLVGELLQAAGKNVAVGGNIGVPVLDLPPADIYVLELSSFQLETTTNLNAKAATILNISEDHLDRYEDMQAYLVAKQRIFQGCEFAVINRDDAATIPPFSIAYKSFGLNLDRKGWGLLTMAGETWIGFGDKPYVAASELKIKGLHNLANSMAALALVQSQLIDVFDAKILQALKAFAGLDHRCQWVACKQGVEYYNDSKGTNVGSTLAAVLGLGATISGKIWLLAGGDGKGQDFSLLPEPCQPYLAKTLLFGRDAKIIKRALSASLECELFDDLSQAFAFAQQHAQAGDIVLLSPACASWDQYKNYVERGQHFCSLVEAVHE